MKANKLSLLLLPLILTGCAGVDPERPAFDALGGVGAGGITYEVTKIPSSLPEPVRAGFSSPTWRNK